MYGLFNVNVGSLDYIVPIVRMASR